MINLHYIKYSILNVIYNISIYIYIVLADKLQVPSTYVIIIAVIIYTHIAIKHICVFIDTLEDNGRLHLMLLSKYEISTYYLIHTTFSYILSTIGLILFVSKVNILFLIICALHSFIYYIILGIYILMHRRYSYNYYVVYIISVVLLLPILIITKTIYNMYDIYLYTIYTDIALLLIIIMIIKKNIESLYINT